MECFYLPFVFLKLLSAFVIVFRKRNKNTKYIKKHFALFLLLLKFGDFYEYEEIKVKMLTFSVGLIIEVHIYIPLVENK